MTASALATNGFTSAPASESKPASDVRLYKNRASYALPAALSIFHENPVAHIAFIHPGDGPSGSGHGNGTANTSGRGETIMNVPLITVVMCAGEDEDDINDYSVYLHTHRHSGLVEAVLSGTHGITATTTKIDGMIFSPTAHDHTLNYRSATLHLSEGYVLDDEIGSEEHEEKRRALACVTNTVTNYDRISVVGVPDDAAVKRTTVIRFKIRDISCKQRYGAFNGTQEPELSCPPGKGKEGDAFTGVIPCWTQWGEPLGYGKDVDDIKGLTKRKNEDNREFAEKAAWANEEVAMEGLGKKRKPTPTVH
ncbi:uncharacterized protein I303_101873 [Kwoniella dejecticola CBS 10117]|uniref:Flavin-nucleotide-binding protein n=1 Tax=Kwoniella dejecticola CBS 10117 TaxID=1296121 RepID=A0A1A6ACK7_9TREE|nr:uncharacterized protein I303_01990 [Kwoniella dejecticola CBS 10117]OBR87778.1 hypothetical protein I303_01990 [Kwoniella dejecticola CBS 10117]